MNCRSVLVGSLATATASRPWYAIRVRSHCEATAASILRIRGYEEFLPVCRHREPRRLKEIESPLFPGYVFARFEPAEQLRILQSPHVLQIVGIGKTPVSVDDAEITALRAIVASRLAAGPWPLLKAGDRVLIEHGPLSGLEGILVVAKNKYRVVVSVTLLQRSVAVEIDREWVRVIPQTSFQGHPARLQPSYSY
jgi:transcription antitermination factor NusG